MAEFVYISKIKIYFTVPIYMKFKLKTSNGHKNNKL